MIVTVLGKKKFHSEKKNTDYYVLAISYERKDYQHGVGCAEKFVPEDVFNEAEVDCKYNMLCDFNGFVQTIEEI